LNYSIKDGVWYLFDDHSYTELGDYDELMKKMSKYEIPLTLELKLSPTSPCIKLADDTALKMGQQKSLKAIYGSDENQLKRILFKMIMETNSEHVRSPLNFILF
jgi:hypothetical protein